MKKSLSLLLVLALLIALTGCSTPASAPASPTKESDPAEAPATASTTSTAAPEKGAKWKIAFSNSYVGNAWRTATVNIFNAYTKKLKEQGIIADAYSSSAGNDVQAQISEVRNMMSEGYNAIVINAASETGLTSVLEEAADRGIVVVAFDATVQSDMVYNVNTDQFEYGRLLAQNLVDMMGSSGNILWIKGIEGNAITTIRSQGVESVLSQYPNIKVIGTGFGAWDDSTTAVEMANLMSAYSAMGIDGILDEGGGGHAIVESLVEYGYDVKNFPLAEGEMYNSFMKDWVDYDMQKCFTTAQPPYLVAASIDVALKVLNGEAVEPTTLIPTPTCASAADAANKWYAPDQDGKFICDWTDNNNTWGLSIEELFS